MNIWIHGANSTPKTFSYFLEGLQDPNPIMIHYNVNDGLLENVASIKNEIEDSGKGPYNLIGHSMGGVIGALLIHSGLDVKKFYSISAPFGGEKVATYLQWWFPNHRLYRDICQYQNHFRQLASKELEIDHKIIVTTMGNNPIFLGEENDGIVTVGSQTAIPGANYKFIHLNHFEILQDHETRDDLKFFLKN